MKKRLRSTKAQVREILDAAKVAVFFIDDRQIVRPNEIGSTTYIQKRAAEVGAEVSEYELEVQFRCAGSDGFVNWIDNTLGVRRTANVIWDGSDGFDFRIDGGSYLPVGGGYYPVRFLEDSVYVVARTAADQLTLPDIGERAAAHLDA